MREGMDCRSARQPSGWECKKQQMGFDDVQGMDEAKQELVEVNMVYLITHELCFCDVYDMMRFDVDLEVSKTCRKPARGRRENKFCTA